MLSRRESLLLGAALGTGALGVTGVRAQSAPTVHTPVGFDVPPSACDCHVHVVPDPAQFPMWSGRVYSPPVATADDLAAFLRAVHMQRVVIVTPSFYGTDNRPTLDGIRQIGQARARGVAVIGPGTGTAELDAMHAAGIRGIRANLETGGVTDPAPARRILDTAAAQLRGRPWHLQVYARLSLVAALKDDMAALPVPVVFDHFAGAEAAHGVDQPGFAAVLDLVRAGKAYVKVSGAYRASDEVPDYPKVAPLAKALIAANPDRLVWGSDWPHTNSAQLPGRKATDIAPPIPVDDGRVLNLLAEWAPDAETRRKILVDNPARLYGF